MTDAPEQGERERLIDTARTKRAVNSLTVERGPKNGGGK